MPKLQKTYTLEITVEQFLRACDSIELQELELLLSSELRRREGAKTRQQMIDKFRSANPHDDKA